jgi:hypothetical protein
MKFLDKARKMHSLTDSESVKKMKIISKEGVSQKHDNTKERRKTNREIGKSNLGSKQAP